ncbi:MAG TPA: helix-turn-helix transcriptional regulator [Rhodopila sp.]|jgi:XRE family aerobic/anaerobic benzoate catabolism transcriptional regulator|nr:helix-turn-helix transcriptional regulator [Rhodopila sp.]
MSLGAEDAAFLHALGQRVRLLRARRGMTRRILAAQSGVSERYISAVESGTGNGSILLLRALAGALNVGLRALLEDEAPAVATASVRVPGYRDRIALIGLRGAGKSTLGSLLAGRLGVPFLELDQEIEREAGLGLGEIMELHGQPGFRRLERAVLDRLIATHPKAVIAAGGGIVAEADTFARLVETCLTVWVRAAPEDHMQRVIDQGDLRPMRDNRRSMADLRAILASREALYGRADVQIETTGRAVADTLAALLVAVGG